jgi:hypothetical protein
MSQDRESRVGSQHTPSTAHPHRARTATESPRVPPINHWDAKSYVGSPDSGQTDGDAPQTNLTALVMSVVLRTHAPAISNLQTNMGQGMQKGWGALAAPCS